MKSSVLLAAVLCLGAASSAQAQSSRRDIAIRFQAMDTNNDGRITRQEWRGNDRSFRNHDWNNDGVLTGDEVRPGGQRRKPWDDRDFEASIEPEDDWTDERFRALDHNNDGRLSRSEWHADAELFSRIDRNRDNTISAVEFKGGEDDDREDRFADLDTNRDGRVTRAEWHGSSAVFDALDANRDGVLTRAEAIGTGDALDARDEFRSVDVNGDGAIARNEWHWNTAAFDRLDANRDGRLTRQEWDNSPAVVLPQQTPAYRAGYERGRQDGVQAGREDKPRGWDLEGQRELEQADAGYQGSMGNRADYQAGYRSGFRRGYREGFGSLIPNP